MADRSWNVCKMLVTSEDKEMDQGEEQFVLNAPVVASGQWKNGSCLLLLCRHLVLWDLSLWTVTTHFAETFSPERVLLLTLKVQFAEGQFTEVHFADGSLRSRRVSLRCDPLELKRPEQTRHHTFYQVQYLTFSSIKNSIYNLTSSLITVGLHGRGR